MATGTANLTDRQLLERFARQHDEEGFTELVQRHGPMVLGVCRQILGQEQDAEDAFQATFLVLSRQAGSIRTPEALPNWLFKVATRLAKRLRSAARRRQAHEVALVDPPPPKPEPGGGSSNLGPILYEEIGRLPDKYRIPFVLCYLEGKTNEQAAQQLGCPAGTVFSRLARARERLRVRLTRRGLAVSSALLAAMLSGLAEQASAAIPQLLEASTVRGALGFGSGKLGSAAHVSARAVKLATWAVRSLPWRGLRMAASLLLAVVLGGALSVLFLHPRPAVPSVEDRLQGTWAAVATNKNGEELQGRSLMQITFKDNQMTVSDSRGTYRIDASKDPMQLDWIVNGVAAHWIFKLDGEEFTLCLMLPLEDQPGNTPPRPQDFNPQPGKIIQTFKRVQH